MLRIFKSLVSSDINLKILIASFVSNLWPHRVISNLLILLCIFTAPFLVCLGVIQKFNVCQLFVYMDRYFCRNIKLSIKLIYMDICIIFRIVWFIWNKKISIFLVLHVPLDTNVRKTFRKQMFCSLQTEVYGGL